MKIKNYYKEKEYIHYSNCHEDAKFVMGEIKGNPKKILSIASALDNCLAFLLLDPDEIVAVDSNCTQIYLCNLKKCAIEHLDYHEYLVFLGIKPGNSLDIYKSISKFLDEKTRNYFDCHAYLIDQVKLVNCGRFEYYFNLFSKKVLPLIHSKKTVNGFFNCENIEGQKTFYNTKFNNLRFKIMFKLFFSKAVMKKLGRDKDYFKYSNGNLASRLKGQFERCVYNNLNSQNPYLNYVVFNSFDNDFYYLTQENYQIIKSRINRITIKAISFEDQIKGGEKYDLLYLSDIFEYMSQEKTDELSLAIFKALNEGGQVVHFNMMNKRKLKGDFEFFDVDQTKNNTFYYMDFYSYLKK